MARVSVNLEQMDALSSEFRRQGDGAASLRSSIDARLGETEWVGQSAETFRNRWSQEYSPMLRRLEEDLQELGAFVAQKREQLDVAGNQ